MSIVNNGIIENAMAVSISRNDVPIIAAATYIFNESKIYLTEFTDISKVGILSQQILLCNPKLLIIEECQHVYIHLIHKAFGDLEICPVHRSKFHDNNFIRFKNNGGADLVNIDYFMKTAIIALVEYCKIDCSKIMIKRVNIENRLIMDYQTINDLSLIKNKSCSKNLFDTINYTKTDLGKKLLKENIIQPYADINVIKLRHELIEFLGKKADFTENLGLILESLSVLSNILKNAKKINDGTISDKKIIATTSIRLNQLICSILKFYAFICKYNCDAMNVYMTSKKICSGINNGEANHILKEYLNIDYLEKSDMKSIDTLVMCINTAIDPYLKLAVQIYIENISDLHDEMTKIKRQIPGSELYFDLKFGYCIKTKQDDLTLYSTSKPETENAKRYKANATHTEQNESPTDSMDIDCEFGTVSDHTVYTSKNKSRANESSKNEKFEHTNDLSEINSILHISVPAKSEYEYSFIILTKKNNFVLCTTKELEKSNFRTLESIEQVLQISCEFHKKMLNRLSEPIFLISQLADCIAEIDVCYSLYIFSKYDNSCLPLFSDAMIISDTYHLLTDKRSRVCNNIYTCPKMFFHVVTGMNMSGKTTYMKTIAQSIILAQIGAPLRGKMAKMKIFKQILTRLSHDSMQSIRMSTFELEVHSLKEIINKATKETLVLLDEVGRGTNYHDGLAFALYVCNELITKECFTYFTTHFSDIIKYIKNTQGVNVIKCLNFSIRSGTCNQTNGIEICKAFFPDKVLMDAIQIKKRIFGTVKNVEFNNQTIQIALKIMECTSEEEKGELKKLLLHDK